MAVVIADTPSVSVQHEAISVCAGKAYFNHQLYSRHQAAVKSALGSGKQISHCAGAKRLEPTTLAMFTGIVAHVAALAQCGEITRAVVAWVVVQMRTGEHHARDAQHRRRANPRKARLRARQLGWICECTHRPPAPIAPARGLFIPPHAVAEMQHVAPMRTSAMLAPPFRTREADERGQLSPIDRVQPAMFTRDRHGDSMSRGQAGRKRKVD